MMGRGLRGWIMLLSGIALAYPPALAAEIYLWTDDHGVVNMTDLWTNIPESMHSRVEVRESSRPREPEPQLSGRSERRTVPAEPLTLKSPPLEMSPDVSEVPVTTAPPPVSVKRRARHSHVLVPPRHRFSHHPKKFFAPFPHNVQLDPFDADFVWVGQSRVPKEVLTFPRISLDNQLKFQERLRALARQRSSSQTTPGPQPHRP